MGEEFVKGVKCCESTVKDYLARGYVGCAAAGPYEWRLNPNKSVTCMSNCVHKTGIPRSALHVYQTAAVYYGSKGSNDEVDRLRFRVDTRDSLASLEPDKATTDRSSSIFFHSFDSRVRPRLAPMTIPNPAFCHKTPVSLQHESVGRLVL
ncbi:hypothetical protein FKW77_001819 [Venturia effusa]|uniref:Uncharacterized protein n=1 Tax=Venturia effusa TaxID=50376 RepID=A0A517L2S2_9PEZI|nr:hypothetical protein FKW77_001819 [Venturia effusa]